MRRAVWMWMSLLVLAAVLATSCKSAFERIRQSGNAEKIYEAANEYYEEGDYQKAQTLYEIIISAYRGKPESEDIYFKYAYTYFHLKQYILASYYFNNFSNTYSISSKREEADYMMAYSNYQLSPPYRLDQTYTEAAIDGFQLYVNTYPDSERVPDCNRLIDEMRKKLEKKTFAEGKLYYDMRHYQSSMYALENLLKDFPDTDNAAEVRYYIMKSAYLLADNSILSKQQERYEDALEKAEEFLQRYSESEHVREISNLRDNILKKLNRNIYGGYQNPSTGVGS